MYLNLQEMDLTISETNINLYSELLGREVTCTLLLPQEKDFAEPLSLLFFNDGQEAANLGLKQTIETLINSNRIKPLMVVAIHAGENRLQEYGVAGKPDFKKRGAKADAYNAFVVRELLPAVKNTTGIEHFSSTLFAGFSLGGLSALDIAWNNPTIFDKAGVFSGSFWWRSKDLLKGYTDQDRIAHKMIRDTVNAPELKIWLQTGTKDETSDRNKNGIIDAIDDTIDLIKELELKGITRPDDVSYVEVVGGTHDTGTWAKALPKFLIWALGR